ncbi:MAG: hypothetical protein GY822_07470 [Deltaproteobacteria bacterium]|nr:hypothetical protein [Deltaproteobacteria bacterium]
MPRARRLSLIGHAHLVTARGNNGGEVFAQQDDFEHYLEILRNMARENLFRIHSYCLMRTELRLLIEPTRLSLAQIMQRVHTSHSRRLNARTQRTGHLFEGRFSSLLVSPSSISEVTRWIHLWPVRRGEVRRAESYKWSSHRTYVSSGDEWGDVVDAWATLSQFGETLPRAQRAFGRFVEQSALDSDKFPVEQLYPGVAGDRRYVESVLAEAGVVWRGRRRPALPTLARRVCLLLNIVVEDLRCSSRLQTLVLARRLLATCAVREAGRSVTEVAQFLERDKAQVSRLVAQGMELMRDDEGFKSLVDQVRGRALRESPTRA